MFPRRCMETAALSSQARSIRITRQIYWGGPRTNLWSSPRTRVANSRIKKSLGHDELSIAGEKRPIPRYRFSIVHRPPVPVTRPAEYLPLPKLPARKEVLSLPLTPGLQEKAPRRERDP